MLDADVSLSLRGWCVTVLRPAADQAGAAARIHARGATALALPALRLLPAADSVLARMQLHAALECDALLFTSPASVQFAAQLSPRASLFSQGGSLAGDDADDAAQDPRRLVLCVGAGTARALRALGIHAVFPGTDAMHSEGLLALPQVMALRGSVGMITAPGGRGVLLRELAQRGLQVRVAHVYRRAAGDIAPGQIHTLRTSAAPRAVLLTSAEALQHVLDILPTDARDLLLAATAVASSPRLAELATHAGLSLIHI